MRYFFLLSLGLVMACKTETPKTIDVSGQWVVKLDSLNQGEVGFWAKNALRGNQIQLPGTLDMAGLGTPNTQLPALNNKVLSHLQRKHQYIGKAWYQREIEIPDTWQSYEVQLNLERVLWGSKVYLDGVWIGDAESLVTAHKFNLGDTIKPGPHLLTIMVDNTNKFPLINRYGSQYIGIESKEMMHGYTNHTQIKWNGILGTMELSVQDANAPKNLHIYAKVAANRLKAVFEQPTPNIKALSYSIYNDKGKEMATGNMDKARILSDLIEFEIPKPEGMQVWDEFHPNLYRFQIRYAHQLGADTLETTFGYRNLEVAQGSFKLNGQPIFLRGNLNCASFPLTGAPPTTTAEWERIMGTVKAYGINHLRFHSWCPPKAAFEVADALGLYVQVELPHWSTEVGADRYATAFLEREASRILCDYGNHPSFLFMTLGNELEGDVDLMGQMVGELKAQDPRHLYAATSFSFQGPKGIWPLMDDDFYITQWTEKGWVRGQGIFNDEPPTFNKEYTENIDYLELPIISHEIGQYAVYPDLSEIDKYTGVLSPKNFIAIKKDLEQKGLLELAPQFTQASGKLAALLYKEEIERALKTPGFDGFQLLQLQDFPGQGTALVGLLNAFWQSKGIITANEFRQFNSELVPLLRFGKAVYQDGERFNGCIDIANYYKDLHNQEIEWTVTDDQGTVWATDTLTVDYMAMGTQKGLGIIDLALSVKNATQLTIQVGLKDSPYINSWPIWVYPRYEGKEPQDIVVTADIETALAALDQGGRVLLSPPKESLVGVDGRFVPVFWSPVHFPDQPATMGILCDPKHPALGKFPTQSHTNWQWWELLKNSKSIDLGKMGVDPIVRVIDNFVTNRSLGNLFEAKVGKGRLVFSSIDLMTDLQNRPVARQLRYSLFSYMKGGVFDPKKEVSKMALRVLVTK